MRQSDKVGGQDGEDVCLDECHEQFEAVHEDAEKDAHCRHGGTHGGAMFAVTNTTLVKARMIMCPAMMLAKRRMVSEKGLVNTPMNSMVGMIGMGALRKMGTSGQKMLL